MITARIRFARTKRPCFRPISHAGQENVSSLFPKKTKKIKKSTAPMFSSTTVNEANIIIMEIIKIKMAMEINYLIILAMMQTCFFPHLFRFIF